MYLRIKKIYQAAIRGRCFAGYFSFVPAPSERDAMISFRSRIVSSAYCFPEPGTHARQMWS